MEGVIGDGGGQRMQNHTKKKSILPLLAFYTSPPRARAWTHSPPWLGEASAGSREVGWLGKRMLVVVVMMVVVVVVVVGEGGVGGRKELGGDG